MVFTIENGVLRLTTNTYQLAFAKDRPYVSLDDASGNRLADLFPLSSVNSTQGCDDTTQVETWQVESQSEDEVVFSLVAYSNIWRKKVYRFRCKPERLSYEIEIEGEGHLAEVDYFGGYFSGQLRWGSGFFWSGQSFKQGFNPEPNSDEASTFSPGEMVSIDLMGVPLPGKAHWFFTPPPFFVAVEAGQGWLGMGVEAQPGDYRFTEYAYRGRRDAFHLSLAYEGYTRVQGHYRLPAIGFDFGADAYETLQKHVSFLNMIKPGAQIHPLWWYEPIFCGWGAQCSLSAGLAKGAAADYSRQFLYEKFLCTLEESGVKPGVVVLDDKWQLKYGTNVVDENKWPDLRGFICNQHSQGNHVLLWLKAWDPEGLPPEECITNAAGVSIAADPTSPAYEMRLRAAVQVLLSSEGYGADGFKIDFTARTPSGPGMHVHDNLWGLELLRRYLEIVSSEARAVKHDALIMAHTPHPYLADLVDMIRLNDINKDKNINQAMAIRAKVVRIACPDAIIDTDNWPIASRAAWRDYLAIQPELGVPSLYYTNCFDSSKEVLLPEDYQLIREVWGRHRARR